MERVKVKNEYRYIVGISYGDNFRLEQVTGESFSRAMAYVCEKYQDHSEDIIIATTTDCAFSCTKEQDVFDLLVTRAEHLKQTSDFYRGSIDIIRNLFLSALENPLAQLYQWNLNICAYYLVFIGAVDRALLESRKNDESPIEYSNICNSSPWYWQYVKDYGEIWLKLQIEAIAKARADLDARKAKFETAEAEAKARVESKIQVESGTNKVDAANTNPAAVSQQVQPSLAALILDRRARFFNAQSNGHLDLIRNRFPECDMIYVTTAKANELYPTLRQWATDRHSEPASVQEFRIQRAVWMGRLSRPNTKPFGRERNWFHCDLKQAHRLLAAVAGPSACIQTYVPGPATNHGYVYAFEHKGQGWIKVGFTNRDEAYCWNRIRNYAEARGLPADGWTFLKLVASTRARELEARLHRKLSRYRIRQDDSETELFHCDVASYTAALASLSEFVTTTKPRARAEAWAYVEQMRREAQQKDELRTHEIAEEDKRDYQRYQRRTREARQRREVHEAYEAKRDAERKAQEIDRVEKELTHLQAEDNKPRFFNFGGKARRQRIAVLQAQLAALRTGSAARG
jgi:hypothetical protein